MALCIGQKMHSDLHVVWSCRESNPAHISAWPAKLPRLTTRKHAKRRQISWGNARRADAINMEPSKSRPVPVVTGTSIPNSPTLAHRVAPRALSPWRPPNSPSSPPPFT